jgi:hypothetical protein
MISKHVKHKSFLELQKACSAKFIHEAFSPKPFPAPLYLLPLAMNRREDAKRCSGYVEMIPYHFYVSPFLLSETET